MPVDKGPKQAPETALIGRKIGCPPLISERAIQRGAYRLLDSKAKGGGNRGNKALRITGERDKGERERKQAVNDSLNDAPQRPPPLPIVYVKSLRGFSCGLISCSVPSLRFVLRNFLKNNSGFSFIFKGLNDIAP